jgi:hypothetical protein
LKGNKSAAFGMLGCFKFKSLEYPLLYLLSPQTPPDESLKDVRLADVAKVKNIWYVTESVMYSKTVRPNFFTRPNDACQQSL